LNNSSRRFEWQINSNSAAFASYNPSAGRITIKDINQVDVPMLQEELFHSVQNHTVPGGTSQYTPPSPGSANIEFESKLLKDISATINALPNQPAIGGEQTAEYFNWLFSITQNGAKLPTVNAVNDKYFYFLNIWKSQQSDNSYNNTSIDLNLPPQTMLNLFNVSSCSK
jgi:hypothetical protein